MHASNACTQVLDEVHRYLLRLAAEDDVADGANVHTADGQPGDQDSDGGGDGGGGATSRKRPLLQRPNHRAAANAALQALLSFLSQPALITGGGRGGGAGGGAVKAALLRVMRALSPPPHKYLPLLRVPACTAAVGDLLLEVW
jgi:hypothetical protein